MLSVCHKADIYRIPIYASVTPKIVRHDCTDLAGGAAIEIAWVDFPC